jgi:hypothetical protein
MIFIVQELLHDLAKLNYASFPADESSRFAIQKRSHACKALVESAARLEIIELLHFKLETLLAIY